MHLELVNVDMKVQARKTDIRPELVCLATFLLVVLLCAISVNYH